MPIKSGKRLGLDAARGGGGEGKVSMLVSSELSVVSCRTCCACHGENFPSRPETTLKSAAEARRVGTLFLALGGSRPMQIVRWPEKDSRSRCLPRTVYPLPDHWRMGCQTAAT